VTWRIYDCLRGQLALESPVNERYNKELAISSLGGDEQWTIAKDRQKETPS
jgi:hypothetical protein